MNILKWFRKSKETLEIELLRLETRSKQLNSFYSLDGKCSYYERNNFIKLQEEIEVLKFKIKNYKE